MSCNIVFVGDSFILLDNGVVYYISCYICLLFVHNPLLKKQIKCCSNVAKFFKI
jgi:hypothetical protein